VPSDYDSNGLLCPALSNVGLARKSKSPGLSSRQRPRCLAPQDEPYDAADDFNRSIDACYAAIRDRVAAGGEGWKPR